MKITSLLITASATLFLSACGQPSTTTLMEKGSFAMWQGRWSDAAEKYTEITHMHPGDWEAHLNLGKCLLELDDPKGAAASLEIANTVVPSNLEVSDLLAECYLVAGDENKLFTFLESQAKEQQTVRAWMRFA